MILFFSGIILGLIAVNLRRSGQRISFDLKPNCLMTRYPLIFIPGKFSFFYCLKYWNNIPYYLKEHGYEATEAKLNWLAFFSRRKSLLNLINKLSKQHKKIHLVFAPSSLKEANYIASKKLDSIQKIHILTDTPLHYATHSDINLHHCRSINQQIQTSKSEYIKMAHDMFTLSPLFESSHLLGCHSKQKHLTIEPSVLENIVNIAENDWV